jgi:hypothetical protein
LTPQFLKIFYETIEHLSEEFYRRGYEDAKAGKPLENKGFSLSPANRLAIKTAISKLTKSR